MRSIFEIFKFGHRDNQGKSAAALIPSSERLALDQESFSARAPQSLEEELLHGKYLQILESYGVRWELEKGARDVWQNFFDNHATLDGVRYSITPEQDSTGKTQYRVRLESSAQYDYRKLVHLGGSSKTDDATAAGGFGEGAKILSLVLLRDFNFSQVKFGSTDWELDFSLRQLPADNYDQEIRGLFAHLEKVEAKEGNFVEFVTSSKENAEAIINARDFFYYSDHPDFKDPTVEVNLKNGSTVGFKFLGLEDGQLIKGHLYDGGQRRHFDEVEKGWEAVEGANFWIHGGKIGSADRDRGAISRSKLEREGIDPLVKELNRDELTQLVYKLEPLWKVGSVWGFEVIDKLLVAAVQQLIRLKVKLEFDQKYIAKQDGATTLAASEFNDMIETQLREKGFTIARSIFSKLGMVTSRQKFDQDADTSEVQISAKLQTKIDLLNAATQLLNEDPEKGHIYEIKEVKLLDPKINNSLLNGLAKEDFTWLSTDLLEQDFPKALATYLHELDHRFGTDDSAKFSYALTRTLENVTRAILKHPEKFKEFSRQWDQLNELNKSDVQHTEN